MHSGQQPEAIAPECRLLALFSLTYARTIGAAFGGVALVVGIVDTDLAIGALEACYPAAGYGFGFHALALVVDGYACGSRFAGIAIGFSVATADRFEFSGTGVGFGFAYALCIRDLALADAKVTVLPFRAG